MSEPTAPGASAVDRLIVQIGAAVNASTLYGPDHPNRQKAAERMLAAVQSACVDRRLEAITFLVVGEDLVVENQPLRRGGVYHEQFVKSLKRRGIERLTIARGLDMPECLQFLEPMAQGGTPKTSAHIVVGQVELATADAADEAPAPNLDDSMSDRIDAAREAFAEFRGDKRTGLRRFEEIVSGLVDALARSTREVLPLAPLKSHDEYTFIHSVNVALLTLAQARSLGLSGARLHEVGMAAMVHDIGKLKVPLEVLNKPGRLEGQDWVIMMSHAELGARHLCGIEGSQPLSIVVAYEHHLRFDGEPTYPKTRTPRRPALASQLTSIADVYDALSTMRPYSKARSREVAVGILTERAGTFHDPALVANFLRLLG